MSEIDAINGQHESSAALVTAHGVIALPLDEASAYRRWQTAVAAYRRAGAALEAAKQEADAAVVELAKYAGRETL